MQSIREGQGTLLDNTILMMCSSMLNGHHNANQLPVVLLGRGGGSIRTGQNLDYLDQPERQMCRLYLSLLERFDIHRESFGDATQPLRELDSEGWRVS